MNNKTVAEKFAAGATRGKGSHLFIEGATIYSYGHHFPVATRTKNGVLVTPRGYSRSTARHISIVKAALGYEYILASRYGIHLSEPTQAEIDERAAEEIRALIRENKRIERRKKRDAKIAAQQAESGLPAHSEVA